MTINLSPIEEILADIKAGKMIVLVDDPSRENEGDLVVATAKLTRDHVAFMMREARGLICVSLSAERAEALDLPLQVKNNSSPFHTQFTVSVDRVASISQGQSAVGRHLTMLKLIEPNAGADQFVSPGNVFPLIADPLGVIGRQGQTEGSYDLARMAGFEPSGVICEILNQDGTMARGDDLNQFAARHGLKITSVSELIRYRVKNEVLVRKVATNRMQTDYGEFTVHVFEDDVDGKEHLALEYGEVSSRLGDNQGILVRIHSECLTGDVFGSQRCDCREQLDISLRAIAEEGSGMVLYLRQEGRGIGLLNKLRAYALQDLGHDTVEANEKLGFAADSRDFVVAAKMLSAFGIDRIRLLTNYPKKIETLTACGIEVVKRISVLAPRNNYSSTYLETKREKMGHLI